MDSMFEHQGKKWIKNIPNGSSIFCIRNLSIWEILKPLCGSHLQSNMIWLSKKLVLQVWHIKRGATSASNHVEESNPPFNVLSVKSIDNCREESPPSPGSTSKFMEPISLDLRGSISVPMVWTSSKKSIWEMMILVLKN